MCFKCLLLRQLDVVNYWSWKLCSDFRHRSPYEVWKFLLFLALCAEGCLTPTTANARRYQNRLIPEMRGRRISAFAHKGKALELNYFPASRSLTFGTARALRPSDRDVTRPHNHFCFPITRKQNHPIPRDRGVCIRLNASPGNGNNTMHCLQNIPNRHSILVKSPLKQAALFIISVSAMTIRLPDCIKNIYQLIIGYFFALNLFFYQFFFKKNWFVCNK